MIEVVLADDHDIVRQGIKRLIDEQEDMRVVAETGDGREVMSAVQDSAGDVLVLDLSLPNKTGVEILEELRREEVPVRTVILSMYPEDHLALNLLHKGAFAYLSKQRKPEELLEAIRRVAGGKRYLTGELAELVVEAGDSPKLPHHRLSAREYQVFILLVQGKAVKMVAAELGVSASTTSNHVAAIKEKLGVSSIADVVRYASRVGLV